MSSQPATPAEAIDRLRNTLLDLAHLAAADLKPGAGWEERLWLYERHVRRSAAAALAATAGAAGHAADLSARLAALGNRGRSK